MIDPIIAWFQLNSNHLGYLVGAIIGFVVCGFLTTAFWFGSRKSEFFHELHDEWEELFLRSHESIVTTLKKFVSPRHNSDDFLKASLV